MHSNLVLSCKYFVIRKPFKIEGRDVFSHVLSTSREEPAWLQAGSAGGVK